MKNLLFFIGCVLLSTASFAQSPASPPEAKPPFQSESEAGAVTISGNSSSESYSLKSKNTYTWDKDIFTIYGRYLRARANGVESARNWEVGGRYERTLNSYLGAFIGHKAESDVYSGFVQRDSEDLGLKYFLTQSDTFTWTLEGGYRYSVTLQDDDTKAKASFGRLYTELNKTLSPTVQIKYWAEYLPNLTVAEAYLANTEASLSVMLNRSLSLKVAYLLQYQNLPPEEGKHADTTFTTALVAKF